VASVYHCPETTITTTATVATASKQQHYTTHWSVDDIWCISIFAEPLEAVNVRSFHSPVEGSPSILISVLSICTIPTLQSNN
jgi:hypothetical protein